MVRITIDEELRKKLFVSDELIEIRDEQGKLLGTLRPTIADPIAAGWIPLMPEPSEEELQRRLSDNGPKMSTEEAIAYLRRHG